MLHEMGVETGIDLEALLDASRAVQERARPAARQPRPDGRTGDVGRCLTSRPLVEVERHGDDVVTLVLRRPPANALGLPIIEGLDAALDAAADARCSWSPRRIAGFFAAGADIKHMATVDDDEFAAYGDALRNALNRFAAPERISIAAIDGLALGGGLELALACTLRVGSERATFGLPEVKLGLIPGAGGTQRLPRLVGRGRALDIMLTGRQVEATEALSIGLDRPPRRARGGRGGRARAGPRAARALPARAARRGAVGRHRRRPAAATRASRRERREEQRAVRKRRGARGHRRLPREAAAAVRMSAFDVTSLRGRRADQRWNRTAVGDLLERLTWSRPDQEAIVGAPGAYFDPRFERVTYRAGRRDRQPGRQRAARGRPRARRPRAALLRQLGRGAADHDRHRQGRAGRGAGQPADGARRPDLGDRARRAAVRDRRRRAARARASPRPERRPRSTGDFARLDRRAPGYRARRRRSTATTSGRCCSPPARPSMPKAVMSSHTYSYMAVETYTLSLTRGLRFESDLRLCTFLPIVFHCGHHAALFSRVPGRRHGDRRPPPRRRRRRSPTISGERATAIWAGSPLLLRGDRRGRRGRPGRRPAQPDRRDVLAGRRCTPTSSRR